MAVKPIPDGYPRVTPVLVVEGAGKLLDFMKAAFGAQERMRMPTPDGKVAHAEVSIGDSVIMVADATPQFAPAQGNIHLYVEGVDDVFKRALAAGAKSEMEPADQFYGDRSGSVRDQFGNLWSIATHIEDVSDEEMMKRMAAMGPGQA